jgi:hypothetical protein
MPSFRLPCRIAAAAVIGLAGACLSFPTLADQSTAVTFQAGDPWTQELGSVNHYNSYRDYSVAVEAGKTFQINLVTRNPNIFFKVKNATSGDNLVDTYKTGATTWSVQNAAAATYTIHVYAQREAIPRGEDAKYALQIGQYGSQDMRPATTEVSFQDNNPWAQSVGTLAAGAVAHDYTVAIAAGKTLQVNLVAQNPAVHFKVEDQASRAELVDTAKTGTATWSTPVAAASNFTIRVYADPASVPPGKDARYALQVGRYATIAAAAAGTAATPASAASAAASASSAGTGR